MPRTRLVFLAPAALVVVLAACGGGGAASPGGSTTASEGASASAAASSGEAASLPADGGVPSPGTTKDACALVTSADIAAAVGLTEADVAAGTLENDPTVLSPGHSECTYEGDFGRIIVDLTPEDGANLYDAAVGSYKDAGLISGLGDGAFHSADNDRSFVWQGPVAIMFTMFLSGDLDATEVTMELGSRALANV